MDKIKLCWKKIPIPVAFMFCSITAILLALLCTNLTMRFAQSGQAMIQEKYIEIDLDALKPANDSEGLVEAVPGEDSEKYQLIQLPPSAFSEEDQQKYSFYEYTEEMAAICWYTVFLLLAATIFYFWKIRTPFRLLTEATEKIARHDLGFEVADCGQDEFGRLCRSFEEMRKELVKNETVLWRASEERKRLNAAFSHDLKTPLTILQGHTDMLLEDLPDERCSRTELFESVRTISRQVTRIHDYVKTMNSIQKLEDYEIHPEPLPPSDFIQILSDIVFGLFAPEKAEIISELSEEPLNIDSQVLSQICENLCSNASRYTKDMLQVTVLRKRDILTLIFLDDGPGFSPNDLKAAVRPYYRGDNSEKSTHFGLGLYICDLLCQKHGGTLSIENNSQGGAKITVEIFCD